METEATGDIKAALEKIAEMERDIMRIEQGARRLRGRLILALVLLGAAITWSFLHQPSTLSVDELSATSIEVREGGDSEQILVRLGANGLHLHEASKDGRQGRYVNLSTSMGLVLQGEGGSEDSEETLYLSESGLNLKNPKGSVILTPLQLWLQHGEDDDVRLSAESVDLSNAKGNAFLSHSFLLINEGKNNKVSLGSERLSMSNMNRQVDLTTSPAALVISGREGRAVFGEQGAKITHKEKGEVMMIPGQPAREAGSP